MNGGTRTEVHQSPRFGVCCHVKTRRQHEPYLLVRPPQTNAIEFYKDGYLSWRMYDPLFVECPLRLRPSSLDAELGLLGQARCVFKGQRGGTDNPLTCSVRPIRHLFIQTAT